MHRGSRAEYSPAQEAWLHSISTPWVSTSAGGLFSGTFCKGCDSHSWFVGAAQGLCVARSLTPAEKQPLSHP